MFAAAACAFLLANFALNNLKNEEAFFLAVFRGVDVAGTGN